MFTKDIIIHVFDFMKVVFVQLSYLFNCRTKLAKFECLNIRGRIDLVKSIISYMKNR